MSHALTTTQKNGDAVLTKEQADDLDAAKAYDAGCRKSAQDHIIYSFLCGSRLERLKQSCQHGDFGALLKIHWPDLSKGAEYRHRETFKGLSAKFPTVGNFEPKLLPGPDSDLKAKEKFLSAVHDNFDGKTITAIWRELGIVRKAKPANGTGRKTKIDLDGEDDGSFLSEVRQDLLLLTNKDDRTLEEAETADLIKFDSVRRAFNARFEAVLKRRKTKPNN